MVDPATGLEAEAPTRFQKALKLLQNPELQKALGIGQRRQRRGTPIPGIQRSQGLVPVQPFQLPGVSFTGPFGGGR